ncbi:MAG TPA: hypothetical protein VLZ77_11135 [Acidimicrobiales bacterium]|nr:hypothetical protein [Acidimicrobiales bacterium]
MDLLGTTAGYLAGSLVVTIGIGVLNFFALYKIITKAGFSGAWILAPLSVIFLAIVTVGVVIHAAVTFSSASLGTAGALVKLDYVDAFLNWILFLVFAFVDWPALRGQPRWATVPARQPVAHGLPRNVLPPSPPPPPPPPGPSPGWYPLEGRSDEQVYWGGRAYTARRLWQDDAWKDIPLSFYSAGPPRPEDRVE